MPSLNHVFKATAPRNYSCRFCNIAADDYNGGDNLRYMETQECPERVRMSLTRSSRLPVTPSDAEHLVQELVQRVERHGTTHDFDDEADPLVHAALLLLLQVHKVHPKGIVGTLKIIHYIETKIFGLDDVREDEDH